MISLSDTSVAAAMTRDEVSLPFVSRSRGRAHLYVWFATQKAIPAASHDFKEENPEPAADSAVPGGSKRRDEESAAIGKLAGNKGKSKGKETSVSAPNTKFEMESGLAAVDAAPTTSAEQEKSNKVSYRCDGVAVLYCYIWRCTSDSIEVKGVSDCAIDSDDCRSRCKSDILISRLQPIIVL